MKCPHALKQLLSADLGLLDCGFACLSSLPPRQLQELRLLVYPERWSRRRLRRKRGLFDVIKWNPRLDAQKAWCLRDANTQRGCEKLGQRYRKIVAILGGSITTRKRKALLENLYHLLSEDHSENGRLPPQAHKVIQWAKDGHHPDRLPVNLTELLAMDLRLTGCHNSFWCLRGAKESDISKLRTILYNGMPQGLRNGIVLNRRFAKAEDFCFRKFSKKSFAGPTDEICKKTSKEFTAVLRSFSMEDGPKALFARLDEM